MGPYPSTYWIHHASHDPSRDRLNRMQLSVGRKRPCVRPPRPSYAYRRTASGLGKEASHAETFWISCFVICVANAAMIALLRVFAEAGKPLAPRW